MVTLLYFTLKALKVTSKGSGDSSTTFWSKCVQRKSNTQSEKKNVSSRSCRISIDYDVNNHSGGDDGGGREVL